MAERRLHGLQRVLGVNALFATAYGNVGSSIYYALGLVAGLALGLTPVVFVITGIFFFCTAATYAEATAMYPEAGGSSSFARHAFNEFVSFFAAWAQMLNYVITVAISAFFVPHYIGGLFWDPLRHAPGDVIFGAIVIALLSLVNVVGIKESAGLNIVLAVVDFFTQVVLVAVGLVLVFSPATLIDNVHLGVAPTWTEFLRAIPLGMIAYTGIETISNMAEEARDEAITIPKAIARVRMAVYAIYFTLPAVALSVLPVHVDPKTGDYITLLGVPEEQHGYAGDPILGVVTHLHLGFFQDPAELYVGLLAATILLIATNAGIIGVSRLVYSMGIHRQVPDRLRQLHPKYGTPWIGIVLFGFVACLTLLPGQAEFLGYMYAFGAMLSFTIAHAAVIRLRNVAPDRERPYRGPGTLRIRGRELPGFAVFGGTATLLAFVDVAALHPDVAVVGTLWLAIGIAVYGVYRHRQGLDWTTTVKIVLPQPVTQTEAEYESVLIALEVDHYTPEIVATAGKLAARGSRGIYVMVTITVPQSSPIDAELPDREDAAQSVIERARLQLGRRVGGRIVKIRAGQGGRVIIDEARQIRAQAIVMPLPPRTGTTLFGKTVETVLAERPCRVIIESEPSRAA
ncbi:MAG: basic amino acid/polyamine antiporter, family [Solirubrobacteraceae bacterium]|jgi:APA family basic amino acid/polyamine antiporter|nr:basic amino acid/polyamine antiporter, family [Solirubrobacteraceae bacterium]